MRTGSSGPATLFGDPSDLFLIGETALRWELDDAIGFGISSVELSDRPGAGFDDRFETAFELFYGFDARHGVRLKPDLQYIVHPGGDVSSDDAWVFTLRVSVAL